MVEVTVKAEAEMTVTSADVDALVTAAQEKGVLGGPFPVLKGFWGVIKQWFPFRN